MKKLVIEISEEDYKECIFRKDLLSLGGEPTDLTFNMRMEKLIAKAIPLEKELENIKTEVNTRKKYIDGNLLFSKIAGHSNYHGDSILSAISCLQEGKEISTIPAIGDNEMRTIDADILEKEIYKLRDQQCDNLERNRAINDVFTVIAFLLGEIPCSNCANRDKTKIIQNCGEIYKCEEYSHFKAERREQ